MAICEEHVPVKSLHGGTEHSEPSADMDVDSLTKAVSRLSTSSFESKTPAVVSFGRRRSRACSLPSKPAPKDSGPK